jgi:hypothetical protein
MPKQAAAPAKSTAHKAATEVPKETPSAEAVEGEVVSAPVRFQPPILIRRQREIVNFAGHVVSIVNCQF